MVLSVDVGFGDNENVVQEQLTKVLEMVTFPIIDPVLEILDGQFVLGVALGLIDLVRNPLCSARAGLQILVMGVGLGISGFNERLSHSRVSRRK